MIVTYNDINNIGEKLREGKYNLQLKYAPKTAYKISYNISQLYLAYFKVSKEIRENFSSVEESEDKYDEFQTYLNEHTLEVTFKTIALEELGEKIDIENMELYRLMIGDSNETN
jgi:hypothetical protein|nr:MAG TPA: hypothetical protein [Caudoviricetes sp.]